MSVTMLQAVLQSLQRSERIPDLYTEEEEEEERKVKSGVLKSTKNLFFGAGKKMIVKIKCISLH